MIIRSVSEFRLNVVGNGDRILFLRVDLHSHLGRINYLLCECGNIWRETLIFHPLTLVDMNTPEGKMCEAA
jgi:hypothetical protein